MADRKDAWLGHIRALTDEVRANRKLQYGLLAIAAIIVVELGLDWSDAISARERRLQELRTELRQLRGQSRDETALKATLSDLERQQAAIEKRLWIVSSDPVGQAKLKDWLTTLAKETGAKEFKLVLATPKAIGERTAASAAGNKENALGLREFRADIGFVFTPETLERMLYAIESGETLASVESLSIVSRTRKAELGVSVVMRLGQPMDAAEAARTAARLNESAGQSKAAGGEEQAASEAAVPAAQHQAQPHTAPDAASVPQTPAVPDAGAQNSGSPPASPDGPTASAHAPAPATGSPPVSGPAGKPPTPANILPSTSAESGTLPPSSAMPLAQPVEKPPLDLSQPSAMPQLPSGQGTMPEGCQPQ